MLHFSRCKILSDALHNVKAMCVSAFVLVTIKTVTVIAALVFNSMGFLALCLKIHNNM